MFVYEFDHFTLNKIFYKSFLDPKMTNWSCATYNNINI